MKILFVFLISLSSLAGFSGKWSGEGFYNYNVSDGNCSEVFMQFKVTSERLYILDGGYICGKIQASYPPSSFKIENGSLFYQNEKVGNITESEIDIRYEDGIYHLNLKSIEGQIHYREIWDDGEDFLLITSKLNSLL